MSPATPESVQQTVVRGLRERRRALFELLLRLEQSEATGLARLYGEAEEVGSVMLAGGRLCFAASARNHVPIGMRLAAEDPAFQAQLDSAVRRARSRGVRLCEALLEEGTLALDQVRAGLLRQTVEALLNSIEECEAPRVELRPARDDYDHRLTFSALEVFLHASAASDDRPADAASRVYAEFGPQAEAAVLLLRPSEERGLPLPVATTGVGAGSLRDVVDLARNAAGMSRPETFQRIGIAPRLVVLGGKGGVWVTATGAFRVVQIRTSPRFEVGQVIGVALRLLRAGG